MGLSLDYHFYSINVRVCLYISIIFSRLLYIFSKFFKIIIPILGVLTFHTNFSITCQTLQNKEKNSCGTVVNMKMNLGAILILIKLRFPVNEPKMFSTCLALFNFFQQIIL